MQMTELLPDAPETQTGSGRGHEPPQTPTAVATGDNPDEIRCQYSPDGYHKLLNNVCVYCDQEIS
jgi:hypothetical protein